MKTGDSLLVHYPFDDKPEWQERVLLSSVTPWVWIVATPDLDLVEVDLDVHEWKRLRTGRRMPLDGLERDCYLVFCEEGYGDFLSSIVLHVSLRDGVASARKAKRTLLEVEPEAELPVVAPEDRRVAVKAAGTGAPSWVSMEVAFGKTVGSPVPTPRDKQRKGKRGLSRLPDGSFILARLVGGAELKKIVSERAWVAEISEDVVSSCAGHKGPTTAAADARTLPVSFTGGTRFRDFVWAEAVVRRMQVFDWVHHEKIREQYFVPGDRVIVEELAAISGTMHAGIMLMLCPSLPTHVPDVEPDIGSVKVVSKTKKVRKLRTKKKGGRSEGKKESE